MKKNLFFLLCFILFCCDDNKELPETIEDDLEVQTRANVGIQSITGETNLQVGLRKTYTVLLNKPLTTTTKFRIISGNSSAIRFATTNGTSYSYSGTMDIEFKYNSMELKFDVLPVKPVSSNTYISITSMEGPYIDGALNNISIAQPTIKIEAPATSKIDQFISVKVPNSYALFGDRIIEYKYDSNYLRYDGTSNSSTGYNSTFYSKQKIGKTKIQAIIKGKINSNEYYEIASAEHNIEIIANPPPTYDFEIASNFPIFYKNQLINFEFRYPKDLISSIDELTWYLNDDLINPSFANYPTSFSTTGNYVIKCAGKATTQSGIVPFSVERKITVIEGVPLFQTLNYSPKLEGGVLKIKLPWNISNPTQTREFRNYYISVSGVRRGVSCGLLNGELTISSTTSLPAEFTVTISSYSPEHWPTNGYSGAEIIVTPIK